MGLTAGSRVGFYEVVSPLGAGGMGEVYRARDTRLGRSVALKVLPRGPATDRQGLARFEQEARSASALNHPNIVTIHDVGESEVGPYIAMELVEGSSLRDVLAGEPLPPKKLLAIAAQIAEGLARAHAAGIVHRDLKPENLMVSRDGFVKILDFGLAKLAPAGDEMLSQAETAAQRTSPGTVMGTVGYMSPEQASGRPADFRTDQFALGSILYEMASGRHPFRRQSNAETLAAIIREDPEPLGAAAPGIPPPLRWVVERCLAKDADERYASTRDLARDLSTLRDRLSEPEMTAAPVRPVRFSRVLPWAVAAFAASAFAACLLLRPSWNSRATEAVRFSVELPPGMSFDSGEVATNSALSPDGRRLVLVGWSRGRSRLYLRGLDGLEASALEGTEGADSPFWSPDGRFVGFFSEGKLRRIPAAGGPPQTLCEAPHEGPGTWSPAGTILFAGTMGGPPAIYGVSADGGSAFRVTTPDPARPEEMHLYPHFLPDGRSFLFVSMVPAAEEIVHELRAGELGSARTSLVSRIGSRVEVTRSGHLLSVRDGSLLAQPFDVKKLRFSGEAVPIVDRLHHFYGPANAGFSVSQSGVMAYESGPPASRLAWLDRAGKEISTVVEEGGVRDARLSPDGKRLAVSVLDPRVGSADVWVYELDRNVSTRLTLGPFNDDAPAWSPDGRRLVFRSDRHGPPDLYEIDASSPGTEKPLLTRGGVQKSEDWSADGRYVLFTESSRKTGDDIWLLPLFGDRIPVPYLQTRFEENQPRFSPDGRWIVYCTDESGTSEVYVSPRGDPSTRTRLSTGGGRRPRWSRDGRELLYLAPDRSLMAVPVRLGEGVSAGAPVRLFRFESGVYDYAVAPGGERLIASTPIVSATGNAPVRVILDWPVLLRKPGPSGAR